MMVQLTTLNLESYTQLQKELELSADAKLKLTGSVRYDKSEFFDGFFSPRLSAGLTLNRNHNIRLSGQTGFRNPTTQDLFIGLDAGRALLVGSAPNNLERYSNVFDISQTGQAAFGQPSSITQTGSAAYNNSYTASSVGMLGVTGNPARFSSCKSRRRKARTSNSFRSRIPW